MATTTFPQRQQNNRGRWIAGGVAVLIVAIVAGILLNRAGSGTQTPTVTSSSVTRGTLTAVVSGSGTVAAAQTLDLPFQSSGQVTEVLIAEGDTVQAGQVLARLDTRELALQVEQAQSRLDSVKAQLEQAQQGNATPQDLAAAQAGLANAQANLQKTRSGNITAADIANAEAGVRSAQARLDALRNPSQDKVSAARLALSNAQTNQQSERDSLSVAKAKAESQLAQAADMLRDRQDDYSRTYWDNRAREDQLRGKELPQEDKDKEAAALRAVQRAEEDMQQAKLALEQAIQAEKTGIATAEARLADAQSQLDALLNPDANDIAQAQAAVDQAQSQLNKLRQGGTGADIAASQAQVKQAQANLDKLTAPQTATDLSIRQASVEQAELDLQQAKLNLENAALKAPFAGIVTAVHVVPGSIINGGATAALSLMDRSTMYIDMKLSENDVAKVQARQPVTLTIDALSDWQAQGEVTYIAPSATESNGVVTYRVRVSFPDNDPRVKAGMTANANIVTATKDGVLLVPNSALLPKGSGQIVQVPGTSGQATREIEVLTGLTDGTHTEIVSGLNEGDAIIATPSEQTPRSSGGLFRR